MSSDEAAAIVPVAEALGVRFYVGGSVVSSVHGVSRSNLGADLVADLQLNHVGPLIHRLKAEFYIDADMVKSAISRRTSFNLIHLRPMMKIDVFPIKSRAMDCGAWSRLVSDRLYEELEREFPIASAEDVVLNKLDWYRAGGEVSERQWLDVVGVMKVRADALDDEYLHRFTRDVAIEDLLERARKEAAA